MSGGRLRHEMPRGEIDDCWTQNRVQKTLYRLPVWRIAQKTDSPHREAIMYPADVRRTSKNSSKAVRVLDVRWICDTWQEASSRRLADVC